MRLPVRHLAASGLAAAALALPAAASAEPAGDAFVVEEGAAHSPSAAYGNGRFLAEFQLGDDAAVRRLDADGVAGATSPVLPGEAGEVGFNPARGEWLLVASDRATIRASVIAADGSRRAPVTIASAADGEDLYEPKVAYTAGQYLVSWRRTGNLGPVAAVEARRLTATGAAVGPT